MVLGRKEAKAFGSLFLSFIQPVWKEKKTEAEKYSKAWKKLLRLFSTFKQLYKDGSNNYSQFKVNSYEIKECTLEGNPIVIQLYNLHYMNVF